MPAAVTRLARWRTAADGDGDGDGDGVPGLAAVRSALDDDLDAPGALAALDAEASAGRSVRAGAILLGVEL
jgi:L-cysteine:1D-myo-inositol 2-amino-2-deoxy-alpha-D-glucopyranoside ligase